MSRAIKFRAWDSKKKEWLTWVPPKEYMLDSNEWDHNDIDDGSGETTFVFPDRPFSTFGGRIVYEQFVGLVDKNGKEIFEGDVLKITHDSGNEYVGEVVYDGFSYYAKTDFYNWHIHLRRLLNRLDCFSAFELVGNIHEEKSK